MISFSRERVCVCGFFVYSFVFRLSSFVCASVENDFNKNQIHRNEIYSSKEEREKKNEANAHMHSKCGVRLALCRAVLCVALCVSVDSNLCRVHSEAIGNKIKNTKKRKKSQKKSE